MKQQTIKLPFDVPLLEVKELKAGSVACLYEHGNLRYLKVDREEVVRMVYSAVRDEHWATAPYRLESEKLIVQERSFNISYTALYELGDIKYKAFFEIEGREDNTISFSMHGEALSSFKRNRIGLCVLHPINECAGQPVVIGTPGGGEYQSHFPDAISPYQPFKNIANMQYETPGARVQIEFEGDIFETEDQRNWTDASFKTYSTPLEIPIPVDVSEGEKLHQKLVISIHQNEARNSGTNSPASIYDKRAFPKIGYEKFHEEPLSDTDIAALSQLPFDHYRVEIHLDSNQWKDDFRTAVDEARKLNTSLELIIFLEGRNDANANDWINLMQQSQQCITRILLVSNNGNAIPAPFPKLYQAMREKLPHVKIGYGTDAFFADLNRNRPSSDMEFDFLSTPLTPQVHAVDTRTIIENLEAERDLIKTLRSFAADKEICISPVTFKMRTRDGSTSDEDPRMYSSFGAIWTLSTIKNLAGASSITFYQATGYRGLLNGYHAAPSPLFNALKQLKEFSPTWIIYDEDIDSLCVENSSGEQMKFEFLK